MKWPTSISLQFITSPEATPIPQLIVHIIVIAKHKGNYLAGPFLTNEKGQIIIAREELENTIKRIQTVFPMDYVDNLEQCTGQIKVLIEGTQQLSERAQELHMFLPEVTSKLANLLELAIVNPHNTFLEKDFMISKGTNMVKVDVDAGVLAPRSSEQK